MTKLDDIQKAVAALPPKDQAKFRAWFAALEAGKPTPAAAPPEAAEGKLKGIAKDAIAGFKAGRTRNL